MQSPGSNIFHSLKNLRLLTLNKVIIAIKEWSITYMYIKFSKLKIHSPMNGINPNVYLVIKT